MAQTEQQGRNLNLTEGASPRRDAESVDHMPPEDQSLSPPRMRPPGDLSFFYDLPYEQQREIEEAFTTKRREAIAERVNGRNGDKSKREIVLTNAADIVEEDVEWLWKPYVPRGFLTLLLGDEGASKTTSLARIVAQATCGELAEQDEPERVLIIGDEDSWEHQWVPKLRVAGANLRLIDFARTRDVDAQEGDPDDSIMLPDDVDTLGEKIEDFALVVIDPLESHQKGAKSAFDPQENRQLQAPLIRVAHRSGAAIVGTIHTNRDKGTSSRSRMGGSITKRQSARHVLLLGWSPDDPDEKSPKRVLIPDKSNLIGPDEKRAISLELDGESGVSWVTFGDEVEFTAKQIIEATNSAAGVETGRGGLSKTKLAEIVIEEAFAHDVTDGHTINERLTAHGVDKAARRARKNLGITVEQNHEGSGGPGALKGSRTTWDRDEPPL